MSTHRDAEAALRLERTFAAPPEAVFDAWTDPEVLRRWWAAGPGWGTPLAEVDLRPGGRYRLSMREGDGGALHTVGGEYVEVRRPERLVYTWAWEGEPGDGGEGAGSLVTVRFLAEGAGTRVTIVHEGLPGERNREMHARGWDACLDNLASRVLGAA